MEMVYRAVAAAHRQLTRTGDGFVQVLFGRQSGIRHTVVLGQQGCQRCRQGATGAVGIGSINTPGRHFYHFVAIMQQIDAF